ncbi:MAG: hypothetical protein ABJL99_22380 [Aliishimia sp.]
MLKSVEDDPKNALSLGVHNLLINCANCQPGQKVLLVHETENDGYFDPNLVGEIAHVAAQLGMITECFNVPFKPIVTDPCDVLGAKMAASDCTIFLARLGDQIRFREKYASKTQIICYALDCAMLSSPFGTLNYAGIDTLKQLIDRALSRAKHIRVTCPAGTDFIGRSSTLDAQYPDVTRKRFPVSVFAPMPMANFSGRVAQRGFLTGTGSNYYAPWSCEVADTLFVNFEANRITGFEGTLKDVAAAKAHYDSVSRKFNLDAHYVHSWHAGIHPGCEYKEPAAINMERWSGSAFGNPRLLHLHTCGDYPPGEISLNVLDPTILIDDIAVWDAGILHPHRIPGGAELLAANPDMATAFANPATRVGQAPCGNLQYG